MFPKHGIGTDEADGEIDGTMSKPNMLHRH
jgi:hypothetical protein